MVFEMFIKTLLDIFVFPFLKLIILTCFKQRIIYAVNSRLVVKQSCQRDLRDVKKCFCFFVTAAVRNTVPCLWTTAVWFSSNVQEVKDGKISDYDILWQERLHLNHTFTLKMLQFGCGLIIVSAFYILCN